MTQQCFWPLKADSAENELLAFTRLGVFPLWGRANNFDDMCARASILIQRRELQRRELHRISVDLVKDVIHRTSLTSRLLT